MAESMGPVSFSLSRDDQGHRVYKIDFKVRVSTGEGPKSALDASGLPAVGSTWEFGTEIDSWAFCTPNSTVRILQEDQNKPQVPEFYLVQMTFSTNPTERCQDNSIEDPLDEPPEIGGTFVKYQREVAFDRFGQPILTSSFERIRGKEVEFEANKPSVRISKNYATLDLDVFSALIDHVNDATMWGLPPRRVKLSNVTWQRKVFGTCSYYYTKTFDLDIDYNGFDRKVQDEGTKVLNGEWNRLTGKYEVKDIAPGISADPSNPQHFKRYQDRNGNNTRVILDGFGLPADLGTISGTGTGNPPGEIPIEYYPEADLFVLDLPSSLE